MPAMDIYSEKTLKTVCCTCLCVDRNLSQLCRIVDGVNNLYYLLSYDTEAYKEGFFKGSANLYICWECISLMKRLSKFRDQACVAQKQLSDIIEGRYDVKMEWKCLSRLSNFHKRKYDNIFIMDSISPFHNNFIDCGPDIDTNANSDTDDTDNIPLRDLYDIEIKNIHITRKECEIDENKCSKTKKVGKYKTKNKSYSAIDCENHFSAKEKRDEEILKSFVKTRTDKVNLEEEKKCELCTKTFKNNMELEKHKRMFHIEAIRRRPQVKNPGSKPRRNRAMLDKRTPFGFSCTECDKHFDNKNARYKHIQRCHREGFACSTCGKKFAFKNNLTRHEQLHVGPLPREQCPTCGKMVRTDLSRAHARTHAQRDAYACAACDKRFVSRASYEHHLKYTKPHATHDILKYKCAECDKGYRSRGELRDHVNYQHRGQTQHKCPVCGKALATPRCITRHVRRAHQGIRESAKDKICQICGKAFRDKKGLLEHESIHSGARPLSCSVCGRTFRQSASLYTHRRRIHNLMPPKRSVHVTVGASVEESASL